MNRFRSRVILSRTESFASSAAAAAASDSDFCFACSIEYVDASVMSAACVPDWLTSGSPMAERMWSFCSAVTWHERPPSAPAETRKESSKESME